MRIVHLDLRVFGPLRGRALDLDSDAVLVYGRNESGKSSFRSALETILFGFDPATRDAHPLYRWDGGSAGDLQLEAQLELGTGEALRVERLLQANGKSRTAAAGQPFRGRRQGNRPLAGIGDVTRELYQSIYSLEIEQLEALRRSVQSHVDDLLLPAQEALDLRPISEVRAQLRRDHQALWRPDRRGRTRTLALREALAAARGAATRAVESEAQLREARREREAIEHEIAELGVRKRRLEREQREAPFLRDVFELGRRRRALGAPVDLSLLGDLPLIDPEALASEIKKLEHARREPAERLARPEEQLEASARAVLAAGGEIELALSSESAHCADAARLEQAHERAHELRAEALGELDAVLEGEAGADSLEAVRELPLESLRAAQTSWARSWERRAATPRELLRVPSSVLALGLAGLVLIVLAVVLDPRLAIAGGVLAIAAAAGALFTRQRGQSEPPPRPAEVDALLGSLPVASGLLERPAELQRLIDALARTRRLLADADSAASQTEPLRDALEARALRWSALCRELSLDESGGAAQRLARMRDALARAREAERRVEADRRERHQAQQLLEASRPSLEAKLSHLERIEQTLRAAERGAPGTDEAYRRVRERLDEAEYLHKREAELRADPRWSELSQDPRSGGGEPAAHAPWLPDVAARREAELEEVERLLAAAHDRRGQLENALRSDPGSQVARARDAVADLETQLHEVSRERDRLALLDSILARAESEYRDAHQPDVMRRASAYLERVTQGRYFRLDYLDGDEPGLYVSGADRADPARVGHPISRGTLDQIFLCLRLGLLDHLDSERETLPLILDDALLRMDDARRPEVYSLLAEIAPRRQIFLLTCHTGIAAEAETALKARRVDLTA